MEQGVLDSYSEYGRGGQGRSSVAKVLDEHLTAPFSNLLAFSPLRLYQWPTLLLWQCPYNRFLQLPLPSCPQNLMIISHFLPWDDSWCLFLKLRSPFLQPDCPTSQWHEESRREIPAQQQGQCLWDLEIRLLWDSTTFPRNGIWHSREVPGFGFKMTK